MWCWYRWEGWDLGRVAWLGLRMWRWCGHAGIWNTRLTELVHMLPYSSYAWECQDGTDRQQSGTFTRLLFIDWVTWARHVNIGKALIGQRSWLLTRMSSYTDNLTKSKTFWEDRDSVVGQQSVALTFLGCIKSVWPQLSLGVYRCFGHAGIWVIHKDGIAHKL